MNKQNMGSSTEGDPILINPNPIMQDYLTAGSALKILLSSSRV